MNAQLDLYLVLPCKLLNTFAIAPLGLTFFAERVINLWNNLPADQVDFGSVSRFKRSVKLVNLPLIAH